MNRSTVRFLKNVAAATVIAVAAAGPAIAGHFSAVGLSPCGYCHKISLDLGHGGFVATSCGKCHASTSATVVNTIAAGLTGQPYTCVSCHGSAVHMPKHKDYASKWNTLSGVDAGIAPLWEQPLSFPVVNPANDQAQVCLKCHSYAGFGMFANGITAIPAPSGGKLTDQALEFNTNNRSAHPLFTMSENLTGSSAPRALTASQTSLPYTFPGQQMVSCRDCHDFELDGIKNSLKGPFRYWPYNPSGQLWTLGDIKNNTNSWATSLFCKNCHPLFSLNAFMNNVHASTFHNGTNYTINGVSYRSAPCVACHVAIPHGAKRSRLIGYGFEAANPDKQPTILDPNVTLVRGFAKTTPKAYTRASCWSSFTPCHTGHPQAATAYEP